MPRQKRRKAKPLVTAPQRRPKNWLALNLLPTSLLRRQRNQSQKRMRQQLRSRRQPPFTAVKMRTVTATGTRMKLVAHTRLQIAMAKARAASRKAARPVVMVLQWEFQFVIRAC
jgi:hypothetical protein